VEHFCVKFGDIVRKKKQTDTQTNGGENRTPTTAFGTGNNIT